MTLIQEYLEKANTYMKNCGQKTVLLMQVGSFYEIYSLNDENSELYHIIYDISKITGLSVVEKSICVGKYSVLAAGFRDYSIDKWIQKIHNNGYTCVVYSQDNNGKNTTRSLTGIYTPGTYIQSDETTQNNNNMCIWLEKVKSRLSVGLSNINVLNGKSHIYEYNLQYTELPSIYDEIERYISVYNPSETTIITNLSTSMVDSIISYVNIQSITVHIVDLNDRSSTNTQKALRCEEQKYRVEIFTKFFQVSNINLFLEKYNYYEVASQSFCYLINFLNILNPSLTAKINEPLIDNLTNRLLLGNHSSKQLNITSDISGKYSCILNLTNNTLTAMGNRQHRENILNPTCDLDYLNSCYKITENIIESNIVDVIRQYLVRIRDIDKLARLIIMNRLPIKGIFHVYNDLMKIKTLSEILVKYNWLEDYHPEDIIIKITRIINFIREKIDIDKFENLNDIIEDNLFKRGVFVELDDLQEQQYDSIDKLNVFILKLDSLMNAKLKPKKETGYLKLHDTDKSGYSIQITKSRVKPLEEIISENNSLFHLSYISSYNSNKKEITFSSQIKVDKYNNLLHVTSDEINSICKTQLRSKTKLKEVFDEKYKVFLQDLSEYTSDLFYISYFIGNIDVLQNRAYLANKYNYCKPEIVKLENSFLDAIDLRHPIIEIINNAELYVANDIKLNEDNNILLFGTNAVGKTSLIKSIGIAIVLAQSGMYVPAKKFTYMPYRQLFTRILNCDNLFKGLSTFTLEMSEMSNILKYADENSLILGDELCSGTELPSAMCIFMSGLKSLTNKKSNFIFATHFHELLDFDEIRKIKGLLYKHLTVHYDNETNSIIYDRKLKDGSGENIYGLEVCKSLYLPKDFMSYAFTMLNKYYKKDILSNGTCRYNARKIKNMCELCKINEGIHTHHLLYQKDAVNNIICELKVNSSIQKNHPANLVNICEECHTHLHDENIRLIKKTTTSGSIFEKV